MIILDSHVHCGLNIPWEEIARVWEEGNIDGGVLFAPVEEIYDREDPLFVDSNYYKNSREKVHSYLESVIGEYIFAYWFVWNDFQYPAKNFSGIKWHRHANEPEYKYSSKECEKFIEYICQQRLPIIIEDEFYHTIDLVTRINNRTNIIIPHLGMLNGGYYNLKRAGIFENSFVYVDTALAGKKEINDFANSFGVDRILFGSDYPFGNPGRERFKIEEMFSEEDLQKIFFDNLYSLLIK